ncbi:MAG TPA: glycosyltransferase family 39 protein [Pyrinomonadaceae bacterium]|nr:glycosyltransferase family 39 protein [Pyrinomonadaceae bacterium]
MSFKTRWIIYVFLFLLALSFRLFIAVRLANDEPDDGRVYSQIARNVLEQHIYSHDAQAPYTPSIIRLPGYPLFLVGIYALFGHGNNTAVRLVQAVLDTITCLLVAWVVFEWSRKHWAAMMALALAAVCPFTAIYVATILTEVPTNFLAVAMVLTATFAFKATTRAFTWWIVTGLIAGLAVLFRPDSGLFAAAIGLTLVLSSLRRFREATLYATIFSLAFCLVLVPWTIRNRRVFHVFQPLAPAHAEMPGEFVPRGYLLWVRTWLDDERYVGPALWSLDMRQIHVEDFPARAFDSKEERDRVAALFEKYNHPDGDEEEEDSSAEEEDEPEEEPEPDEHPQPEDADVEMTPEIDAGFAQIGQERVAHARLRYYVVLPLKRGVTLWFDTHSQYYPFNGELLPLEDLDHDIHQQYWLPLFAGLTWAYTLLSIAGGWLLWSSGERRWLLMMALLIFLRLGFFATLENPEPRYTVEIFPFLIILGAAGLATMLDRIYKIFSRLFMKNLVNPV